MTQGSLLNTALPEVRFSKSEQTRKVVFLRRPFFKDLGKNSPFLRGKRSKHSHAQGIMRLPSINERLPAAQITQAAR